MRILAVGSDPNTMVASLLLTRKGHSIQWLCGSTLGGITSLMGNAPFDPALAVELGLRLPEKKRGRLGISRSGERVHLTRTDIRGDGITARDQERWLDFVKLLDDASTIWKNLYQEPAGDVMSTWRQHPRGHAMEILRLPWSNLRDFLDDWFESDLLKATLAASALMGSRQGPFACGTVFLLLRRWAREEVLAASAPPLAALRERLLVEKVEIIEDSVAHYQLENGRLKAVQTQGGQTLEVDAVISGEDPVTTLTKRLKMREISPELGDQLVAWKTDSTTATATVDRSDFHDVGVVSFTDTVESLERAFDPTKYGRGSQELFGELETEGGRLWLQHCVSDQAAHGVSNFARTYELHEPSDVLMPADLGRTFGLSGGHLFGGEVTLWQSMGLRDVFSNPIPGLYLCGAGTGPGDYSGLSGRLCAERLIGETQRVGS